MAITITQGKKKQRYLIMILVLIVLGIFLIIRLGFSGKQNQTAPEIGVAPAKIYAPPKVDIDWQLLENLHSEALKPFEDILPFEGEFGRQNPFVPY